MPEATTTMEKIVSLAKRRGFVFPSSEIYGGLNSCWDYGPLGVELKNNVKQAWWRSVVQKREDMVGLDAGILMHPRVWEACGHVQSFTDPLVDCKACKQTVPRRSARGRQLPGLRRGAHRVPAVQPDVQDLPGPGGGGGGRRLSAARDGPGHLRQLPNVLTTSRKKMPFGIAQIGKSFRNEITPGNFTFRTREFEQMEMEFFVKPGTDEEWHQTGSMSGSSGIWTSA